MSPRKKTDQARGAQHRADPYQPGQLRLGVHWGNVSRFAGPAHKPMAPVPGPVGLHDLG
mgnify:CR=1 FL=1